MVRTGPVVPTVPGLFLDVRWEVQLTGVSEVHFGGELGQLLVSEACVSKECDDRFVPSPEIRGTSVGGSISHRVNLLRGKPDSSLLALSFRIR